MQKDFESEYYARLIVNKQINDCLDFFKKYQIQDKKKYDAESYVKETNYYVVGKELLDKWRCKEFKKVIFADLNTDVTRGNFSYEELSTYHDADVGLRATNHLSFLLGQAFILNKDSFFLRNISLLKVVVFWKIRKRKFKFN